MSEWISVKDRLPQPLNWGQYERYIITWDGKVSEASWLNEEWCLRHDGCSGVKPTHWMYLPEPPEDKC